MKYKGLLEENKKLVSRFGASPISKLKDLPDFYAFKKGLVYSHRDFDKFFRALKKGEKCAIVSGFNASGTIHLGHKIVFDINLYFQREYGLPVFVPISDDESYVTGKAKSQEEALKNALKLGKELLAYGFDAKKTYFIIDQIYTNIYNLAIKLSKKVTLSEIKAAYGYKNEDNVGMHFYPSVQSAHILLPQEKFGIKHVLVPIGPDEDSHIRICRDIASRMGYEKPAILHSVFLPGIDGNKMAKSRNNAIYFNDDKKTIIRKVNRAFSGGQKTIEEHRKKGGNPDVDIACLYLSVFFLNEKESKELFSKYRKGDLLSRDVKNMLKERLLGLIGGFQERLKGISDNELDRVIMRNE
jgi:tryptophanyl-tRNA synthetase